MTRRALAVLVAGCSHAASPAAAPPTPASPHVEDAWWTAEHPCPSGELRTDALRFADGSRRTLAVYCQDGEHRVGRETTWYPNGALRSRGAYVENRPTGDWVLYWPTGLPWYRVTVQVGRPVRHGQFFGKNGVPLAMELDLPVTGVPECDDELRAAVQTPAERDEAISLANLVLDELENRHRDQLGRCAAPDDAISRVVPDDAAFAATFARFRAKPPGTCAAPAPSLLAGLDLDEDFDETCKACGFAYRKPIYPRERCSSLPAPIAGLPLVAGTCPDNELTTDSAPFGERVVVEGGKLLAYQCHATVEHELDRGSWTITVPVAATSSTAAASDRVVAVLAQALGKPTLVTEAFTRFEDRTANREITVAREPIRSNNDAMSPAQRKALGLAGSIVIEVERVEREDDEFRHPRGK